MRLPSRDPQLRLSRLKGRYETQPVEFGLSRGIRKWACANGCLIRANPLGLRIQANCESARQGLKKHNIKKACDSLSYSRASVSFANPCKLRIIIPRLHGRLHSKFGPWKRPSTRRHRWGCLVWLASFERRNLALIVIKSWDGDSQFTRIRK